VMIMMMIFKKVWWVKFFPYICKTNNESITFSKKSFKKVW